MLARLRRIISTSLYGGVLLQELNQDERRAMWPVAPTLSPEHVRECRVFPDRVAMLDLAPKGGVCAEVGVFLGDFSQAILERNQPSRLHLIDIEQRFLDGARARFPDDVASGRVSLDLGDSSTILRSMPEAYFDWVYIDGDHTYEGCKKDIEAAADRLKPGGLILLNDYVFFGAADFCKYGVMEVVNEFCLARGFEFAGLALQGRGYFDVALKRMG
ncbi:MAG TPA: class I SAM-dependent methyltransferase [Caulobacteraceae bacterium]